MDKLEHLKNQRTGQKAYVKKIINEFKANKIEAATLISIINSRKAKISELNDNIITNITEAQAIQTEIVKQNEYEEELEEALRLAEKTLAINNTTNVTSNVVPPIRVNLPKLQLKKFDGNVLHWYSFWKSYEQAIHNSPSLGKVEKFNYLLTYLEGPAYRAIKGLTISEHNYDAAIKILQDRYGDQQVVINLHMDKLLSVRPVYTDEVRPLKNFFDFITVHTRSLENLGYGEDKYGMVLMPLLLKRLPKDFKLKFADQYGQAQWKYTDLISFLEREIHNRERVEISEIRNSGITTKSYQNFRKEHNQSTEGSNLDSTRVSSFLTADKTAAIVCVFCSKNHKSQFCRTFSTLQQRQTQLRKKGLCFGCLKQGHLLSDCGWKCSICQEKHHFSICPSNKQFCRSDKKPVVEVAEGVKSENVANTNIVLQTAETSMSEPAPVQTPTTVVTSHVSSVAKKVLLQTAKVQCISNQNTSYQVNALFDKGSHKTYITNALAERMGFVKLCNEVQRVNTFGTNKSSIQRFEQVKVPIKTKTGVICLTASTVPVICANIKQQCSRSDSKNLHNIDLSNANVDGEVDLLIGCDCYWKLVTGQVRNAYSGPVAMSSKVGWLVSGSQDCLEDNYHCHTVRESQHFNNKQTKLIEQLKDLRCQAESTESHLQKVIDENMDLRRTHEIKSQNLSEVEAKLAKRDQEFQELLNSYNKHTKPRTFYVNEQKEDLISKTISNSGIVYNANQQMLISKENSYGNKQKKSHFGTASKKPFVNSSALFNVEKQNYFRNIGFTNRVLITLFMFVMLCCGTATDTGTGKLCKNLICYRDTPGILTHYDIYDHIQWKQQRALVCSRLKTSCQFYKYFGGTNWHKCTQSYVSVSRGACLLWFTTKQTPDGVLKKLSKHVYGTTNQVHPRYTWLTTNVDEKWNVFVELHLIKTNGSSVETSLELKEDNCHYTSGFCPLYNKTLAWDNKWYCPMTYSRSEMCHHRGSEVMCSESDFDTTRQITVCGKQTQLTTQGSYLVRNASSSVLTVKKHRLNAAVIQHLADRVATLERKLECVSQNLYCRKLNLTVSERRNLFSEFETPHEQLDTEEGQLDSEIGERERIIENEGDNFSDQSSYSFLAKLPKWIKGVSGALFAVLGVGALVVLAKFCFIPLFTCMVVWIPSCCRCQKRKSEEFELTEIENSERSPLTGIQATDFDRTPLRRVYSMENITGPLSRMHSSPLRMKRSITLKEPKVKQSRQR